MVLQAKTLTIALALAIIVLSVWPSTRLGTEFMPNLNEGTLLYMPTTLPGLSVTKSAELLQMQDRIIRSFPEVELVYGKAGRAQTATDPAPIEMFETVINLKPKEQWRPGITVDSLIQEMDRSLQFPASSQRLDHADQGPRHIQTCSPPETSACGLVKAACPPAPVGQMGKKRERERGCWEDRTC